MAENNNKQENIILCGANSYQQKYYFNEEIILVLRLHAELEVSFRGKFKEENAAYVLGEENAHDLQFLFDVFREKFEFLVEVIFLLV